MHRTIIASAIMLALTGASAIAQTATPASAPAQPQPFRTLSSHTVSPWQLAWIGNDEKVNHCALIRSTKSDRPTKAEPKFVFLEDKEWSVLRLSAVHFHFPERRGLEVTIKTATGPEMPFMSSSAGPALADIRIEPRDMPALLASPYLDVTVEGITIRLAMSGVSEVMGSYKECLDGIGKPAKKMGDAEFNELLKAVESGKAKCTTNKRTNTTMCDVN
jgi:hypothetical protein